MSNIPTPHISAKKEDIAKTVLMPGDPLRSKFIAEHFLEDAKLVNNVRGVQGYTGLYKGVPITVMASGMGMPSIGIYSYELFNFYDVDRIIRVGSAGAISDDLALRDIVAGMSACTDSNFEAQFNLPGKFSPTADFTLLRKAVETAENLGTPMRVGSLLSHDKFYDDSYTLEPWQKMHQVLAVEMESAALYMVAARAGKQALCICTISDAPLRGLSLSSEDREKTFTDMMKIALETGKAFA